MRTRSSAKSARRAKRADDAARIGRPPDAQGAGPSAPQLSLRLDATTEAALCALRAHWQSDSDGVPPAAAAVKRAIVATAERECGADLERALAVIRERRAADSG